jgi:hypothetical protein
MLGVIHIRGASHARRMLLLASCIAIAAVTLWPRQASAYAWMIRHDYQGCVPCHADPSGAGLLTEYGRAMGENILRSRYGTPPADEVPGYAKPFFGLNLPEWLLLGASLRGGAYFSETPSATHTSTYSCTPSTASCQLGAFSLTPLVMEADLKAQLTFSRFRAYGSMGYAFQGAAQAQITTNLQNNLVSREHWLGVDLGDDKQFLLRAGRIDVPFGLRIDEHDFLVRNTATTNTNIDQSQEYGLAFYYSGKIARGEIMGIAGNYLINPDTLRRRGYSGYLEFNVAPKTAFGVSSMVTYQGQDAIYQQTREIRNVHGVYTRWSPVQPLVLLAEADAFILTSLDTGTIPGFISLLQADVEPTQGLHLIASGEAMVQSNVPSQTGGAASTQNSFDGGAAILWFFAPHADVRMDVFVTSIAPSPVLFFILPQLHVYL